MLKWRILLPTNLARNTNQRSTAVCCFLSLFSLWRKECSTYSFSIL